MKRFVPFHSTAPGSGVVRFDPWVNLNGANMVLPDSRCRCAVGAVEVPKAVFPLMMFVAVDEVWCIAFVVAPVVPISKPL